LSFPILKRKDSACAGNHFRGEDGEKPELTWRTECRDVFLLAGQLSGVKIRVYARCRVAAPVHLRPLSVRRIRQ